MNDNHDHLIKNYFFEPLGWCLGVVAVFMIVFSKIDIIVISNVINFGQFIIVALLLFSYSLNLSLKRLSLTKQRKVVSVAMALIITTLIVLSFIYVANFQSSEYQPDGSVILYYNTGIELLAFLYVISFVALSLYKNIQERTKDAPKHLYVLAPHISPLASDYGGFMFYSIGLLVVFFAGLALRIKQLYELSFWVDESTSVLVAKQVLDGNGQTLLSGEIYGRATIYHEYLAWFMKMFSFLGLNTSTRLANLPFYLIIFFGTFFIGKYAWNKRAGFIAATLFSFSWISVSMFREARFYEMFLAAFILFCFSVIYVFDRIRESKLLYKSFRDLGKLPGHYYWQITFGLIAVVFFGWVSFNTQEFLVLILYSFILFGVLVALFKRKDNGIQLTLIFTALTLIGAVIAYGSNFQWIYVLKAPPPPWKLLYGDYPFTEFWNYLIIHQYAYLSVVLVLSIPCLIYVWDKKMYLIYSIALGWFSIIAIQGYGSDAVRYYYPALPFILIVTAIVFETLLSRLKTITAKGILSLFMIGLIGTTFYGGWVEGNSAMNKNSLNRAKNSSYEDLTDFLASTGEIGTATMVTDGIYSMSYYLAFNQAPDYVVLNQNYEAFDPNQVDQYVGSKQINYTDLANIPRPAYVAVDYSDSRYGTEFIPFIQSIGGSIIFKNNRDTVFYIPAATLMLDPASTTVSTTTPTDLHLKLN